jgi:predicted Rossmann fold nucleotide-binding protein DprA/Smf involved in DNA uptake
MLVTSAADVIEHLSPVGAPQAVLPAAAYAESAPARPQAQRRPASRRLARPALDRDGLDLESAQVLDAMPGRGGMETARIAQRAGLTPKTVLGCLGSLASAGFIERCEQGWRLRRASTPLAAEISQTDDRTFD